MYTETGYLTPAAPFDFAQSLAFLGFFPPTQSEQSTREQALIKAVFVEGQLIAFRIVSTGTIEEPRLDYTLYSEQAIDERVHQAATDRISFYLSLDDDLRPFYAIGEQDAAFQSIIQELYGYHQVKFLTPFETACWAVLTQRNPMNMSKRMKTQIVESYGGSLAVEGETYTAFPEATRMAQVSEESLIDVVHNARKAEYLGATAQAFEKVDEHFLRTGPYDEVESWLRGIRGFGVWSSSFVMIRGLGRMEYLPSNEKMMLAAAERLYGDKEKVSYADMERIADRYGRYKGYWGHYLRIGS